MGYGGRTARRRIGLSLVGATALLVGLAPWLASRDLLRDPVVKAALPLLSGRLKSSDGSWGWFSPVVLEGVAIATLDGATAMELPLVQGDHTIGQLVCHPRDLGAYRVERARIQIVVGPAGVNLANLIAPQPGSLSLGFALVDAAITFRNVQWSQDWQLGPVALQGQIQASSTPQNGQAELLLRPGKVCQHVAITPPMCRDLLQYTLPVVAGTTAVSGDLSLELDEWQIPLGTPQQGVGAGRLTVHRIDVGPGAIAQRLATLLHLPEQLTIARESTVEFRVAQGRVYHRNLTLGEGPVRLRLHGSVGFDESLEMVAEVTLADASPVSAPLAALVKGLSIPIGGTLRNPQIDTHTLKATGRDLLQGLLSEVQEKRGSQRPSEAQPPADQGEQKSLLDKLLRVLDQR